MALWPAKARLKPEGAGSGYGEVAPSLLLRGASPPGRDALFTRFQQFCEGRGGQGLRQVESLHWRRAVSRASSTWFTSPQASAKTSRLTAFPVR